MTPPAGDLAALAVLGAVLALDASASPSLLVSQPLFSGALCGALLGSFEAGIAAGAVMQLLWIGGLPVGGALLPDAMLSGIAAAACAPADLGLAGGGWLDDPRLAAPALVGVGAAYLGRAALRGQRRLQERLARDLPRRLAAHDWRGIDRMHLAGVALHALRGAIAAVFVAALAPAVVSGLWKLGVSAPAGRLALVLGGLALVRAAGGRRRRWPLALGLLAGAAAAFL